VSATLLSLAVVLLLAATGCGPGGSSHDQGDPDAQAGAVRDGSDLLLGVARKHVQGGEHMVWAASWQDCSASFGHQVTYGSVASFAIDGADGADGADADLLTAVESAARRAGWSTSSRSGTSLELERRGLHATVVSGAAGVSINVGTGCLDVSGDTARRLLAESVVHGHGA